MGSGKRKYNQRPKKISLGKYPKTEKKEVNKEDLQNLISLWHESKEKNKKEKQDNTKSNG